MSQESEYLYQHFQSERKVLSRWLMLTVSTLVFFLVVFQPYLSTLQDLVDTRAQLQQETERLRLVDTDLLTATQGIIRASDMMGDASTFQDLYKDAQTWLNSSDEFEQAFDLQSRRVNSLRNALNQRLQSAWQRGAQPSAETIAELKRLRPDMMTAHENNPTCFFTLEIDWLTCQLDRQMEAVNQRVYEVFYDRTNSHEYTDRLEAAVLAGRESFRDGLSAALVRGDLNPWLQRYLENEQLTIRQWYEFLATERGKLEDRARQHQASIESQQVREEELQRLQQKLEENGSFDTPIGSLPLAFHDLLMMLPFLMLLCGCLLLRSQLRLLLLRSNYLSQPGEALMKPETMELTMPVWMNPARSWPVIIAVSLLLLIPAMAALWGLIQLQLNTGLEPGFGQLNLKLIIGLSWFGMLAYLCFLGRLAWQWKIQHAAKEFPAT